MQPKEKASELVFKFMCVSNLEINYSKAKQCALIAVDEVLKEVPKRFDSEEKYWKEVKKEIEKI
ncbi:hypothetical protein N9F18_00850 [bacterium]|nr:hypothetical protein [bacterium]